MTWVTVTVVEGLDQFSPHGKSFSSVNSTQHTLRLRHAVMTVEGMHAGEGGSHTFYLGALISQQS
jgi:hypothetical protein